MQISLFEFQDRLLAELLQSKKEWIYKYHEHDSLLERRDDENLTEEERKAAWEEYEAEKKGLRLAASMSSLFYLLLSTV